MQFQVCGTYNQVLMNSKTKATEIEPKHVPANPNHACQRISQFLVKGTPYWICASPLLIGCNAIFSYLVCFCSGSLFKK